MTYEIRLLETSAITMHTPNLYLIEACGTDTYLKLDGRIKNIHTVHEKAFDHAYRLRNIRKYAGFTVYKNGRLVEVNKFKDFAHIDFKVW